jgi:hypothetical protein
MRERLELTLGRSARILAVAGLICSGTCLLVARAHGYCRTTTCAVAKPAASCVPPVDGCDVSGIPLVISRGCITFSVNAAGSVKRGISATELQEIVSASFTAWENVDCGDGQHPSIRFDPTLLVTCSKVELSRYSTNQNVWTFVDQDWLSNTVSHTSSQIALTTVEFTQSDGHILGVDVELNSDLWNFATESFNVNATTYDLRSVVQHESGHFFGLSHSNVKGATMAPNYPQDLSLRTLEPDDKSGICAIYPPGTDLTTCDSTPLGGFSKECAAPDPAPDDGCCTIAPVRRSARSRDALLIMLGVLAHLVRHQRRVSAES